jgi:hypothetical protein
LLLAAVKSFGTLVVEPVAVVVSLAAGIALGNWSGDIEGPGSAGTAMEA